METEHFEKKSLKLITGSKPDYHSLARECVGFANAKGGSIVIGIENDEELPRKDQKISDDILSTIRKRISELTINVGINVIKETAENGGEYIKLVVFPSQTTVASTTDGQYFIRISDQCKPVLPDELSRLFNDKPAFIWETKVVQ